MIGANAQDATIAFVFASEHEAHEFYKKVANRSKYARESLLRTALERSLTRR